MKKILLFTLLFALSVGCKNQLTGRRHLTLLPSFYLDMLSASSFQQVLSESRISANVQQNEMLDRVGNRIRKAVEEYLAELNMSNILRNFAWEFVLIDDPSINAWVMPGGRIAFYTGILPICANEDGIAVVMGHEIAHAVLGHGNERMSQGLIQQFGTMAVGSLIRDQPETVQGVILTTFGIGSTVGVLLPYSRKREYEADWWGLKFMAMAGYDPREAPRFWERMMAVSRNSSSSDFLSTHPANAKRIAELNRRMPEAMKYFRPDGQPQPAATSRISPSSRTRDIRQLQEANPEAVQSSVSNTNTPTPTTRPERHRPLR